MSKNRRTISIDYEIYNKFKLFCDKNNLKISKSIEKILFDYINKIETKDNETYK